MKLSFITYTREIGPCGSHIKVKGVLKRTNKRYQNLILWAWLQFISPLHVHGNYRKRYRVNSNVAHYIVYLNTLRGTKPQIFTPKRYDDPPRHFYMGAPPTPPGICPTILTTYVRNYPNYANYQNPFDSKTTTSVKCARSQGFA